MLRKYMISVLGAHLLTVSVASAQHGPRTIYTAFDDWSRALESQEVKGRSDESLKQIDFFVEQITHSAPRVLSVSNDAVADSSALFADIVYSRVSGELGLLLNDGYRGLRDTEWMKEFLERRAHLLMRLYPLAEGHNGERVSVPIWFGCAHAVIGNGCLAPVRERLRSVHGSSRLPLLAVLVEYGGDDIEDIAGPPLTAGEHEELANLRSLARSFSADSEEVTDADPVGSSRGSARRFEENLNAARQGWLHGVSGAESGRGGPAAITDLRAFLQTVVETSAITLPASQEFASSADNSFVNLLYAYMVGEQAAFMPKSTDAVALPRNVRQFLLGRADLAMELYAVSQGENAQYAAIAVIFGHAQVLVGKESLDPVRTRLKTTEGVKRLPLLAILAEFDEEESALDDSGLSKAERKQLQGLRKLSRHSATGEKGEGSK